MVIHVVKTREQMRTEPPIITHDEKGALTRKGALIEARKLWGDLGTIASDDDYPRLVWCIGRFNETTGRGKTWEIALERSTVRKRKLDQKALAAIRQAAESLSAEAPAEQVAVQLGEVKS